MQEWLTVAEQRHSGITIGEARGDLLIEIGEAQDIVEPSEAEDLVDD
jgi:hypothetical protein